MSHAYHDRTCKPNRSRNLQAHHISNVGCKEEHQFVPCSDRFVRSIQGASTFYMRFLCTLERLWSLHDKEMERKEGQASPCRNLNVQPKSLVYVDLTSALMCTGISRIPRSLHAGRLESIHRTSIVCRIYQSDSRLSVSKLAADGTQGHLRGPHPH